MYDQINWTFHIYFMLFFAVLGLVLFWRMRKANAGWRTLADRLNFIFQERDTKRLDPFRDRFLLTGASVVKQPLEILYGSLDGREMVAFNWFFQSEASLNAVRGGFATMVVRPKNPRKRMHVFHKNLADFVRVSGESVMVLNDEAFSNAYTLFAKDRKAADALFTPELIQFLLAEELWLELSDSYFLLAFQGAFEPENFEAGLQRCRRLLSIID